MIFAVSLLIPSSIALLVGCGSNEKTKLSEEVKALDKDCPMNMGMTGDMMRVSYDDKDNMVKIYYSINDDNLSIEALKRNEELAFQALQIAFNNDMEAHNMVDQMVKADASMEVTFKSANTGNSLPLKVPLDKLQKLIKTHLTVEQANRMWLENQMALENARCPYQVDEGVEMVKMGEEEDNLVYTYRVDEDLIDISEIEKGKDKLKKNWEQALSDSYKARQVRMLSSLKMGMVCRFVGDKSGKIAEISFTAVELGKY